MVASTSAQRPAPAAASSGEYAAQNQSCDAGRWRGAAGTAGAWAAPAGGRIRTRLPGGGGRRNAAFPPLPGRSSAAQKAGQSD